MNVITLFNNYTDYRRINNKLQSAMWEFILYTQKNIFLLYNESTCKKHIII
jgi:hypothetical protein